MLTSHCPYPHGIISMFYALIIEQETVIITSNSYLSWLNACPMKIHQPICILTYFTSSAAQGGGGSFKNRKPIGEVGCCESGMAERIHWWTERCLRSPTFALSFSDYLPTYLSSMYLSTYRSISLSLPLSRSLFHLMTYLSIYLWSVVVAVVLWSVV